MPSHTGKGEQKKGKWLKIELSVPSELVDAASNFVTELGAQGVYQEIIEYSFTNEFPEPSEKETLKAFFPFDKHLENCLASLKIYMESLSQLFPKLKKATLVVETVEDENWGEEWKKYFLPLRVSKNIVIKPTWERYSPAGHDIVIEIDPGMAFGTGQHPSTRMCMEALEDIILKHRTTKKLKALDVGTGTGILGIACAKLGVEKVLCVDIDKKAAEIAKENVTINQVEDKVKINNCDVFTIHESFDLIVANLTAKILIKLRTHLLSLLKKNGYMIISGIIEQNKNDMEKHFIAEPFVSTQILAEKEWVCYVLKKGA
jgi:ribosomal protein L11 methyltransferase